jgi:3-hydroxyisobutyrate dehydrogenase-like beta-hydroxyacid dehydrogenase
VTGSTTERSAIGFIGLGAMGALIARRLLTTGHDLMVNDIARRRWWPTMRAGHARSPPWAY